MNFREWTHCIIKYCYRDGIKLKKFHLYFLKKLFCLHPSQKVFVWMISSLYTKKSFMGELEAVKWGWWENVVCELVWNQFRNKKKFRNFFLSLLSIILWQSFITFLSHSHDKFNCLFRLLTSFLKLLYLFESFLILGFS